MKKPLTFVQRNIFLIAGLFIIACMAGACGVAWILMHDELDQRAQKQFVASTAKPAPPPKTLRQTDLPMITGQVKGDSQPNAAPEFVEVSLPKDEMDFRRESGLALMQKFLLAKGVDEKCRFVHDAARVRPLMERYYESEKLADPVAELLLNAGCYRFENGEILHLNFAPQSTGRNVEAALRRIDGKGYALDWESFTGASETGWDEVQSARPTSPVKLRALATLDDYYNYEFSDEAGLLCVKLQRADMLRTLYAYCPRASATAEKLRVLLGKGKIVPLTVRIAFPKDAKSNNCTELVEVIAKRWLLP